MNESKDDMEDWFLTDFYSIATRPISEIQFVELLRRVHESNTLKNLSLYVGQFSDEAIEDSEHLLEENEPIQFDSLDDMITIIERNYGQQDIAVYAESFNWDKDVLREQLEIDGFANGSVRFFALRSERNLEPTDRRVDPGDCLTEPDLGDRDPWFINELTVWFFAVVSGNRILNPNFADIEAYSLTQNLRRFFGDLDFEVRSC